MNEAVDEPPRAESAERRWQSRGSGGLSVFALPGSYGMRMLDAELHGLRRTVSALEHLLQSGDERRQIVVQVYLTDPLGPSDAPDRAKDTDHGPVVLTHIVQPDAPPVPVAAALTPALIHRWFGPAAVEAPVIVAGLAGVAAERAGQSPPISESDAWVREERTAGRSVSIFTTPLDSRVATSFVAYLLKNQGAEALRHYLAEFDPARRDQAALTAFRRPIGSLEEAWLGAISRENGESAQFRKLWRQLRPLLRPHLALQSAGIAFMIVSALLGLVLPLAGKYLLDTVIPSGSHRRLIVFAVVVLALYGLNALVGIGRSFVLSMLNQEILVDLQLRMFTHLQALPHAFYARAKVGDVMSRLTSDLQAVQMAVVTLVGQGLFLAFSAVVAAIALLVLSPLLGVLVLIVVPVFAAGYLMLESRFETASRDYQRLMGESSATVQENLSAHAVIKAFGLAARAVNAYRTRRFAARDAFKRLVRVGTVFDALIGLTNALGEVLVLSVGGYLVIDGQLTVGTLLAFLGILPMLFQPVAQLSGVAQTVQQAAGALDRVGELLDEPITIADRPGALPLPALKDEIRLDNVDFGYEPGRLILRGLDLRIPAGSNVAIVGPSGSGKSTIANLLLRFYDPDRGHVRFDGHDARDLELDSLRRQIGIVFQDTFVFDSTLRDNIAIGRLDASDKDVARAAEAARLDAYVASLPAGYDTMLGERGVRMSGGQRQRLAIARALLRNPRILVLDEATSALDAQTEAEIQATLAEIAHGRTTISITHRLTSAADADGIIVLKDGQVAEQGSFTELVAGGGLFQQLYEEQVGGAVGARRQERESARLRALPIFADAPPEALSELAGQLVRERFAAGETIVRQGDEGAKLYVITEGRVTVSARGTGAAEQFVNRLGPGDFFGEMALIAGEPRAATVRADATTETLSIARPAFLGLLERDPKLNAAIASTIAGRKDALAAALQSERDPSAISASPTTA